MCFVVSQNCRTFCTGFTAFFSKTSKGPYGSLALASEQQY